MDLTPTPRAAEIVERFRCFLEEEVLRAESAHEQWRAGGPRPGAESPVLVELKAEARERGLWNLGLRSASGLTHLDYAPIAELAGRSPELAPAAINAAPPDSVNMVMLDAVASTEQRRRWLDPLLSDEFRSAFAMTEPEVSSSDATNIATTIEWDGDAYVVNGRKWYITGAANPRCAVLFVVGRSDPTAPPHRRHSLVVVPTDAPGVRVVRSLPVFGYDGDQAEITFSDVRVPAENLLGERGRGFAVGQTRLAAARLQHCMRTVGLSERALEMTCRRAMSRVAFGRSLARQGTLRSELAASRIALDRTRLLIQHTAALVDRDGATAAQANISAAKVLTMRTAMEVIERAISVHGALGLSDDVPLARWWALVRGLHIADGPEEVHLEVVARHELRAAESSS
ncbi:acyl-CoA dehydrogenase family protein [Saccharopolyspora shandongensis]|uniref:acyl-CoA dehydrogenase family protein n=1 Tax=Saccharopolyspora shandongensis TaxID=418495 RepID=UPI0033CB7183